MSPTVDTPAVLRDVAPMNPVLVEAALFARGAVRRGRHLRVRCPVPEHVDTRPSCDYDRAAHVWVCRSCGRGGGLRELSELLGVTPSGGPPRHRPLRPPRVPPPPPSIAPEDWEPAWLAVLEVARRQRRRLAPYRDVFRIADWLRPRHQAVADARRLASALGETNPQAWRLLSTAARVAAETQAVEAELDAVTRHVA